MHTQTPSQPQADSQASQEIERRICVFTPSPLYTITVEQDTDAGPEVHFHVGGQGFWVARMTTQLEVPTTLCAPFGGESGRVLMALLDAEQVEVRPVCCQGANGGYIHDRRSGQRQIVAEVLSAALTRHEADDLYNATLACGLRANAMVLTGPAHNAVVPTHIYRRLAHDLGANGCPVLADLSGTALLAALEGGIYFLKISVHELMDAGYAEGESTEALIDGIERLHQAGAQNVIISRGEVPALALVEQQLFEIVSPRFEAMDARGSGDSMTAAFAVGTVMGMDTLAILRFAAAAGALNVTRHGLGTGQRQNIMDIATRVEVRPLTT
jgi:1-phosphofructokinase